MHDKDFVGNKWAIWIPPFFLLGNNETTKGTCGIFCYSHSSYFAEVPDPLLQPIGYKDFIEKWGISEKGSDNKYINHATPKLVVPNKPSREKYEENPF